MIIDILTLHPELLKGPFEHSIMKIAQEKGLVQIRLHQLRDYSTLRHAQVDDYQYGGGAGMVIMVEPLAKAIEDLKSKTDYSEIVFLTPDGEVWEQSLANQWSVKGNLLLICGHYKGIDERIRTHYITKEISVGSFVLSGGELAAAILVDSIVRLIPGVLGDETSALTDSFQDELLAPPVYTRPADYEGWKVPEVLLSGDHEKIESWRLEQALERTKERRPDLLKNK